MRSRVFHADNDMDAAGTCAFGASLLELILVLAILSVAAAVAAPRFANSSTRYRVDLAARRIASDLNLARSGAKAAGAARTVTFFTNSHTYRIDPLSALDGAPGAYVVELAKRPYEVKLISASFAGSSQVTFNGWGLPDTGGTVTLMAGTLQKTVALDGTTGQPRVQ